MPLVEQRLISDFTYLSNYVHYGRIFIFYFGLCWNMLHWMSQREVNPVTSQAFSAKSEFGELI